MDTLRLGINGMGRIGRLALRHALQRSTHDQTGLAPGQVRKGPKIEVVAANDLADAGQLAYLLSHDSVHRCQLPKVEQQANHLKVGPFSIALSSERDLQKIPWSDHGVDVVLECTGKFTNRESLELHKRSQGGPSHIVLSAPGKGVDKTIVVGVNEDQLDVSRDHFISNASCTTNAITPVIAVLDQAFGVDWALVGTTHAYTGGQGLIDTIGGKDDWRRGRAAGLNLVPTSTGAAKAVGEVLPHLRGKIDGTAVRIPVADGSLYDVTCLLRGSPNLGHVLEALHTAADSERLRGVLDVRDEALVSSDIISDPRSSIVDVGACIECGPLIKVVGWYDNEWAYAARLIDLVAVLGTAMQS